MSEPVVLHDGREGGRRDKRRGDRQPQQLVGRRRSRAAWETLDESAVPSAQTEAEGVPAVAISKQSKNQTKFRLGRASESWVAE
jgi:hypothetical protein